MFTKFKNHGSWVCETCMAKTCVATHNLWPEGASMPQTDFCMVRLISKNHPTTHQSHSLFKNHQKPNGLTLNTRVKVMNVVNSLLHHIVEHVMAWFQSAATTLFTISAEASAWQFRHPIARTCHCMFETPQTWPSCNWDVLLAISCAWAPCTPTSLPRSHRWVNALFIRNAEAKAWTAWIMLAAATCCRNSNHKESRIGTGRFGLHGSSAFHDVQSTKSSASPETKQWNIPVVPHEAAAEVSSRRNVQDRLVVVWITDVKTKNWLIVQLSNSLTD